MKHFLTYCLVLGGIMLSSTLNAQRQFSPLVVKEIESRYQLGLIDTLGDVGRNSTTGEILVGFGFAIKRDTAGFVTKMTRFVVGEGDYDATATRNGNTYEIIIKSMTPMEEAPSVKAKEIWYRDGRNDTLVVIQRFDTTSKTFIEYQKEAYTYFPDGRIKNMLYSSSPDSGKTWNLLREARYVYDAQNRIDSIKNYYLDQSVNYFTLQRYYKVYRTGNRIDSMYFYIGSELTGIFEPRFKDISQEWYSDERVKMFINYRRPTGGTEINTFNSGNWFNQTKFKNWTSLGEIQTSSLNIYPQPATNKIMVEGLPEGKNYLFELITLSGAKIQSGKFEAKEALDVSGLNQGIYLLRIESADGSLNLSKKVIKQ